MPVYITKNHFSGISKVHERAVTGSDGLAAAVRGMAQYELARAIGTGMTALTDSSGGNASNSSANIGQVSYGVLSGSNMAQKAELETAFGLIKDALTEIAAKVLTDNALVPGNPFGTITNSIGGAAADGTIAALDVSMTGVNTSIASAAGTNTVLTEIVKLMKQATYKINQLANAVGVAPLTDDFGENVTPVYTTTFAALSTGTGTAVSGADATAANGGALKTEVDAALVKIANGIAKMASKLNAIQAYCDAPTPYVIAG